MFRTDDTRTPFDATPCARDCGTCRDCDAYYSPEPTERDQGETFANSDDDPALDAPGSAHPF